MKKILLIAMASLVLGLSLSAQAYKGAARLTEEQKLNDLYCTGLFKSTDGVILDVASNLSAKNFLNILDWLPGRVAGVQVFTNRSGVSFPVIRGSIPGIYVDEIPVSASFLSSLNTNDVAIIKIIKTPFFGGFNGSGGAIAIYTLRGEEEEEE